MRKSVVADALATVPFKDIAYYGDYNFTPYDEKTSANLIIVAKK
jgi:glutamate racemase